MEINYRKLAFGKYGFKKECEFCRTNKGRICIHHKDKNQENNLKENLQVLCNSCHISLHHKGKKVKHSKETIEKIKKSKTGLKFSKKHIENNTISKYIKVNQYDLDGNFIKTWKSLKSIKEELGLRVWGNCKGYSKTAGGFIWKYYK